MSDPNQLKIIKYKVKDKVFFVKLDQTVSCILDSKLEGLTRMLEVMDNHTD